MKKLRLQNISAKKLFLIIIVAFFTVFIVPTTCSIIVLHNHIDAVKREISDSNYSALDSISRYMDSELSTMLTIANSISRSVHIKMLNAYGNINAQDGEFVGEIYSLADEISQYRNTKDVIEDVYVFFNNSNLIVSCTMFDDKVGFFEKNYKESISYDKWEELLNGNNYQSISVVEGGNSKYLDIYFNPGYLSQSKSIQTKIVVRLSHNKIINLLSQTCDFVNKELYVVDKNDTIILQSGNKLFKNVKYDDIFNTHELERMKSCLYSSCTSQSGWKYVLAVGQRYVDKKVFFSKVIVIIDVMVCFILALIIFIFSCVNMYIPIKKIAKTLNGTQSFSYDALENVLLEHKNYKAIVKKYKKELDMSEKNGFFKKLTDSTIDLQSVLDEGKKLNISFCSDCFLLLFVCLYNYEQFFEGENIEDSERQRTANYLFENIFRDLYSGISDIYSFSAANGKFFILMNFNNLSEQWKQELTNKLEYAKNIIEKEFKIYLVANVGSIFHGIENMPTAFNDIILMNKKTKFIGSREIIFSDEMANTSVSIDIDNNKFLEKLSAFVQSGDLESSKELVNCALEIYSEQFAYDEGKFKVFILKIASLLHDLSDADKNKDAISCELGKLLEFSSYDLCIKSLDNLIEIACTKENNAEKIENSEENKKILNMISKIKEYIASKYSDSSITLSSIGSYVGVTPYYASRIFKEYEGINLADYISQYRINKAKEFLKENCNLSINQLCDMVGFGSERTFIRAFQKLEKITFGQFKKELKKLQKLEG